MAEYVFHVAYDNNPLNISAITCFRPRRGTGSGIEMSVGYTGKEADILLKILTEQGYLSDLLSSNNNEKGGTV